MLTLVYEMGFSALGIKERKEREREMRRQQIRDAAIEMFMQKGWQATTIEDIAQKAELSPATIYLYFKNKEELYSSLNRITLEYLFEQVQRVSTAADLSPQQKMRAFGDAMYNTYLYEPLILRNIFRVQLEGTVTSLNPELRDQLNSLTQRAVAMIAAVFAEGVCQGVFIPGNAMAQADILWGVFAGLVLWEEAKKSIDPRKDFLKPTLDRAFEVICRGIEKNHGY
jgi:AcrR family transcriptional regulator